MNVAKEPLDIRNIKGESGIFCEELNEKTFGAMAVNLNSRDIAQITLMLLNLRNTFLRYSENFVLFWAPNCVWLEITV